MSRHRFFLEGPLSRDGEAVTLPLSSADVHHAVSVLRVRVGEELDAVEPSGTIWRVRVTAADPNELTAAVVEQIALPAAGAARVTLAFGVSKGSKNDDIVEGAVEGGVARVLPVLTARSVGKLDDTRRGQRGDRWRRVALAAAKQSKRATIPEVGDPATLADTLPLLAAHDLVIVAWEESEVSGRGVRAAIADARAARLEAVTDADAALRVAIVVGPEGGLRGSARFPRRLGSRSCVLRPRPWWRLRLRSTNSAAWGTRGERAVEAGGEHRCRLAHTRVQGQPR